MSHFWKVITREEAERLYAKVKPLDTERIHIRDALGRVMGRDIVSGVDVPHFRRSSMDGYAVRAEDTHGASENSPVRLKMVGRVEMGKKADVSIGPGETAQISTGGMLPQGSDAVVMVEYSDILDGDAIAVNRAAASGENVLSVGEDVRRGERILRKGTKIRAQEIGVLAAIGVMEIPVYRRPSVAILSTGDELVPPEQEPQPGEVRGTNLFTLAALIVKYGGSPVDYGIVRDNYDLLRGKVAEAIEACDIVAISGGSSVGSKDMTISVVRSLEADGILAHGVAVRPGKPTILAMIKGKPVVGLPGHPVSATVIFGLLVRPIIYRMMNSSEGYGEQATIRAKLSQNVPSPSGREDYLRVALRREKDQLWADPILGKSGAISTLTRADGLVRIGLELEGLEEGQWVEVKPF